MIIVRLSLALETSRDKVVFCTLSTYYGMLLLRAPDLDSRVWAYVSLRWLYLCVSSPATYLTAKCCMGMAWHSLAFPLLWVITGNIAVQRARAHKGSIERCTHSLPGSVTSWMPACWPALQRTAHTPMNWLRQAP